MGIGDWGLGIGDWGLGTGEEEARMRRNFLTHLPVGEFRLRGNRAKSRFNYREVQPHLPPLSRVGFSYSV
ncbi:MAG: hypothetical protein KME21_21975 [Desmonostoc vinosum HA7617-LM4]|nr:hypothetical protein [Desmonostoc vinosum HA7617-LM4]